MSNSLADSSKIDSAFVYSACKADSALHLLVVGFKSWILRETSCCMNPLYTNELAFVKKGEKQKTAIPPRAKAQGFLAGFL